ncbi:SOS response-associated peptidase [Corynebacterium sp. SCR221107]|uniref:SOS response-associated peptidase n=1 Tax=Corynebacterium sp. SCR221107 TaxID=3017361 RepID=UPI0022EC8CE5|nr:SOS response-associated peptidase [Corynebacterium sp. SCR221107]WBT09356.1 SOS response-associated peptidase [Corynebacterium sp. SCR221107]
MCGRFVLFSSEESLLRVPGFQEVHAPAGLPPARYNVAPTQIIPILRPGTTPTEALVEPARWGLLPHWKKDESGPPLFNARAETVTAKPSFRDAFKHSRCLIPMDGYYEWHTDPETREKTPYWISTGQLVWVAGLWATGLDRLSATMITTASRPPLDWVHDRMPRFLLPDEYATWLFGTPNEAATLLHPVGEDLLNSFSVRTADKAVGNVRNDYPELIAVQGEPDDGQV